MIHYSLIFRPARFSDSLPLFSGSGAGGRRPDAEPAGSLPGRLRLIACLVLIASMVPLLALPLQAQELNADVTVDLSRINGTSTAWLGNMEQEIEEYLNGTRWTGNLFSERERVDVAVQIILLTADDSYRVTANMVIRSQRPIYNTLQSTPLFLYSDENWEFQWTPNRTLVHDELQFDAMTTVLDYYAYMVLGWDFDTFSRLGGTSFYTEARNLVSLAQTYSSPGWSRNASRRNRALLAEQISSPSHTAFREALYRYHRMGLDQFLENPAAARNEILASLRMIGENMRTSTGTTLFDLFFSVKHREIAAIFQDADLPLRQETYELLSRIDPSHLSAYDALRQ